MAQLAVRQSHLDGPAHCETRSHLNGTDHCETQSHHDGTPCCETQSHLDGTAHCETQSHYNVPTCCKTQTQMSEEAPITADTVRHASTSLGNAVEVSSYMVVAKKQKLATINCPVYSKIVTRTNIRCHVETHSTGRKAIGICVCKYEGIFLVGNSGKPVHVRAQIYAGKMKFHCEMKQCQMMFGPASRGMQNYMCKHVLTSLNLTNTVVP